MLSIIFLILFILCVIGMLLCLLLSYANNITYDARVWSLHNDNDFYHSYSYDKMMYSIIFNRLLWKNVYLRHKNLLKEGKK